MLIIDGKRLVPAPFVNLTKNVVNSADGRPLSSNFSITLQGTLLPTMGSPSSSGTWHTASGYPNNENYTSANDKFGSILSKQDALRELFASPGVLLEYGPDDGSPAVIANVKLQNLTFTPGPWVDRCEYQVVLDATNVTKQGTPAEDSYGDYDNKHITQANYSIQITESEDGSGFTTITKTISAVGTASYDNPASFSNSKQPWENAKDWVVSHIDDNFTSYIIDSALIKYNTRKTESIDKLAGSYSLTITYNSTVSNNTYINNYDISIQHQRSQSDDLNTGQSIQSTYTINGTIQGLASTLDQDARISSAETAFNSFESSIPGLLSLNSDHLYVNKSISKNRANGTLSYSLTYTNFPSQSYIHTFSITDNENSSAFSTVSIQGTIQGLPVDGDITGAFSDVVTIWNSLKSTLYTVIANNTGITVNQSPATLSIGFNKSQSQLTYNALFYYVDENNPAGGSYYDSYDISINDSNISLASKRNTKIAIVTINGTIIGFSSDGSSVTRYNNAKNRYDSIKTSLKNRIESVLGLTVANRILARTESFNKNNGTITYSYNFSLNNDISDNNVISRQVTIDIQKPKRITAVQLIPGLSNGPIIQDIGTKNEERKTLNATLVLDEGATDNDGETYFQTLVETYKPTVTPYYLEQNTVNYNIDTGQYQRTISWIYRT